MAALLTAAASAGDLSAWDRPTLELTGRAGIADDGDLTAAGASATCPAARASSRRSAGWADRRLQPGPAGAERRARAADRRRWPDRRRDAAASARSTSSCCRPTASRDQPGRAGVGTNDRATLTGNVLEDEKILGTVHVAFGASAGIGGTVSVPIHLDVVVLDAIAEDRRRGGARAGRFMLD